MWGPLAEQSDKENDVKPGEGRKFFQRRGRGLVTKVRTESGQMGPSRVHREETEFEEVKTQSSLEPEIAQEAHCVWKKVI